MYRRRKIRCGNLESERRKLRREGGTGWCSETEIFDWLVCWQCWEVFNFYKVKKWMILWRPRALHHECTCWCGLGVWHCLVCLWVFRDFSSWLSLAVSLYFLLCIYNSLIHGVLLSVCVYF